ncbi:uncharacterized mitochondrial protein AtMg00300-like [Cannabis sativa]|uniref:uncharacterized mitochondrial protein AtMg00300-like n=1 Tax=Cannabis sativa TaxID=3483 RepID=UPI0029CA1AB9|nr:uncharacterized mitochondrial protein AtMg00300-like [Cannabis sativa]
MSGCIVKIDENCLKVLKGSLTVINGEYKDSLYYLVGEIIAGVATPATYSKNGVNRNKLTDQIRLLHQRFGHGILKGKLHEKLDFYEQDVFGKSCKLKFSIGTHTSKQILDYIHSDLWGPSTVKTLGKASYFLSIIDDYSRKVWMFLL